MKKNLLGLSILVPMLLLLPNCDWFKQKAEQKEEASTMTATGTPASCDILLKICNKPVLTTKEFEEYVSDILKAKPEFKQLMAFMPDFEKQLYENRRAELMLIEWVDKNGISDTAAYKEDLKRGQNMLKGQLAIKYFQEEFPKKARLEVTDTQAKAFYEENKDTVPGLALSAGGVNGQGVMFDKEDEAKAFFEKAKAPGANFEQLAKDTKLTVRPFKNVTATTPGIDAAVREKFDTAKKFPSVELVKGKDKFWVVNIINKEQAKYVPFDQVKDELKQHLKLQKLFTEGLEQVKKELDVEEKGAQTYFDKKKKEREEELEKMQKEAMKKEGEPKKETTQMPPVPAPAGKAGF